ncbi:hypothetical protein BDV18DRAFT_45387 [Aspergillus unguis]
MADTTSKNLIAVIIGAVLLFGAISVLPIVIMRRHRRRAAQRHGNELNRLESNGCMRQVSVQRWLDQQRPISDSGNNDLEGLADESCAICLTSLLAPSTSALPVYPSLSGSTMHSITDQNPLHLAQAAVPLPSPPNAAHISHSQPELEQECCSYGPRIDNDDDRIRPPRRKSSCQVQARGLLQGLGLGPQHTRPETSVSDPASGVLILNRCNHAFHRSCIAIWFQYQDRRPEVGAGAQYRCPICSDVIH